MSTQAERDAAADLITQSKDQPFPVLWLAKQTTTPEDFIAVLSRDAVATRTEILTVEGAWDQHEKEGKEAAEENAQLKDRLKDFSSTLEELEETKEELEKYKYRAYAPQQVQRQEYARIDVDKFDGSPAKLRSFLFDMSSKIMTEGHIYGTVGPFASAEQLQLQLRTYVSHTTDRARAQLEAYCTPDGQINLQSVEQLIQILQSAFGDVDEVGTAQRKIHTIKQGNRNLGDFLAEWQILAGKSGFDSAALIYNLKQAIHPTLLRRTTLFPYTAATWMQFIDVLRAADQQERVLDANYFKKTNNNNGGGGGGRMETPADPDAMDLSKAELSKGKSVKWTKKDEGRRPKTDDERRARKVYCAENDLCNWCYSEEHLGAMCPTAIWNKDKDFYTGKAKA